MKTSLDRGAERVGRAATVNWLLVGALTISIAAHARSCGPGAGTVGTAPVTATADAASAADATPRPPLARDMEPETTVGERRRPTRRVRPDRGEPRPEPASQSGSQAQRDALCDKASRALQASWRSERDEIVTSLRRTLPDHLEQQRTLEERLQDFDAVLELDGPSRAWLEGEYASLRAARVHEAVTALAEEPPDLEGVLEAAKDLFQAEDRLIREAGGPEQVARWRVAELESRTTILALLASLAGVEWDEDLVW